MKRKGYLYEKIYEWDNLVMADEESSRGKKSGTYGVRIYRENRLENLRSLQQMLIDRTFSTSEYKHMELRVDSGKVRKISKLPYFPDRILHHAIMQVIGDTLIKNLIYDTYACIKGRGIHFGVDRIKRALNDLEGTKWCLKTDIHKFYPSIDHDATMGDLKRIFKDKDLLALLENIVRSVPAGVPIGSYTSQLLANMAVSRLDHYIKEELKVKYYFRYCDDMVFLAPTKGELKRVFEIVQKKLNEELKLEINPSWAIFPVGEEKTGGRTIDFLGYRFTHEKVLLRKAMKQRFARKVNRMKEGKKKQQMLASYKGWCMHGDCRNLWYKITGMKSFKELGIKVGNVGKDGKRYFDVEVVTLMDILNQDIIIKDFETDVKTKNGGERYAVLIDFQGKECKFITNSYKIKDILDQCKDMNYLPFSCTVKRKAGGTKVDYYFE